MKTQKERILEQIKKHGFVSNIWAVNNYILRLGARINELREDGMELYGVYGNQLGFGEKHRKDFHYCTAEFAKKHGIAI